MGQEGIWSCAVASSLNALHALGVAQPVDNEDVIIQTMGGRGIFSRDGGLPMGHVREFMESRGLLCRESGNIIELMQTLQNGGVAILARQAGAMGHAVLVSGAETRNGQVYLRVNDPLGRTEISREPADGIINQLNFVDAFANMYLVEDPRNLPEITILE